MEETKSKDRDDCTQLQATPKRSNKRLLSANSVLSRQTLIEPGTVKNVSQAILAENQSMQISKAILHSTVVDSSKTHCMVNPFFKAESENSDDEESRKKCEIILDLVSNWGHSSRIGLTEVQFVDSRGKLMDISEISVTETIEMKGDLMNLHNNKTKTVKERCMWSCAFHPDNNPVQLTFVLFSTRAPHSIKIWNFNHNIKDLVIGVKQVRIFVDGRLIFDGILDKACGNQVFDYSQLILLQDKSELTESSNIYSSPISQGVKNKPLKETMDEFLDDELMQELNSVRCSSARGLNQVPVTKSELLLERRSQSGIITGRREERKFSWKSQTETSFYLKSSQSADDDGRNLSSKSDDRRDETRQKLIDKPTWLQDLNVGIDDSNPQQQKSSMLLKLDDSESFLDLMQFEEAIPKMNDDERPSREGSAKYGRRALPSPTPSIEGMRRRHSAQLQIPEREESARTRSRRTVDRTLEESWTSLNMFNRHHRGRLSINMEGDVLDNYIDSEKVSRTVSSLPEQQDTIPPSNASSDFIIPELPEGRKMAVNIKTTWGDRHYVGLNGIEIFASTGEPVTIEKITANPADINILPEYSKDPRVVTNLIDGVHRTRDDMHLWLTPFTPDQDHWIFLTFDKKVKLAMIRIWNYNKSRIHSFRGAKDIEIMLDGICIFKGEIARACGGMQGGIESFGDTILFTTEEGILEAIAKHDQTFSSYTSESAEPMKEEILFERPRTAHQLADGERPMTCAQISSVTRKNIYNGDEDAKYNSFGGQILELKVICNWGDPNWIGLTGLEILDEFGEVVSLSGCILSITRDDSNATKSLNRLIDGINVTTSDEHMWKAKCTERKPHKLTISLNTSRQISGIRLWNFNSGLEESYRGVRFLQVNIDGKLVSPVEGFLIRKAPGNCHFDFAQEVTFAGPPQYSLIVPGPNIQNGTKNLIDRVISQDYEAPVMPRGFVFQFQLYSSWGDPYYIGLNGLELYDAIGNRITLTENNIAAYPDSVNVLDNVNNDVRTPDKLVDGVNDTVDGHHMWLAPVLPNVLNRVYIVFDYPVTISMIKIWSYAKTPARNVKEFGLLVDDLLVYHSTINQIPATDFSKSSVSVPHHTILFTSDKDIIQRERNSILTSGNFDQDVQLTNERQVVHRGTSAKLVDQALRPMTSLTSTSKS